MSDTTSRTNSGILFINDRKKNNQQPSMRGKSTHTCPHCKKQFEQEISAWTKVSERTGSKMLTLAFQEPYRKEQQPELATPAGAVGPDQGAPKPDPTDNVPF